MTPRNLLFWALLLAGGSAAHAGQTGTLAPARFDWFDYRGNDRVFDAKPSPRQYRNPIIAGFYPDPSITRVGQDYYMVNSTFGYFPGLPIWHSRDLVSWTQIGNAIDRPGMLNFKGLPLGYRGIYAPTIRYHQGRFVLVTTCVDCGGHFVLTATNPAGPWSDPVWIKGVGGIDPQIYFEGDRAWLVNHDDPAGPSLYAGHKAIWIREISPDTFQPLGPGKMIIDGGVNIAEKPPYVEGPHLFKRGDYYYLSAAEGGTGMDHRQVVWRSKDVMGPYVTDPANPILTQRNLPADRPDPITSTGHADMVETQNGEWWAVFLGTRTYEQTQFNTGRETYMLPVRWTEGWPVILDTGKAVPYIATRPALPGAPLPPYPTTGNFDRRDTFDHPLGKDWLFLRIPDKPWWSMNGGSLAITPRAERLGDVGQPSIIARRLQHMNATATTRLHFAPKSSGDEAGMVALQNDNFYYAFGLTRDEAGREELVLRKRAGADQPAHGMVVATAPITLHGDGALTLRTHIDGPSIAFSYSLDGKVFHPVGGDLDARILSTMHADGFVGATVGMYAETGPRRAASSRPGA